MTKMIAIFRVFYCLRIWRRTNGDKWTGQMVKQRKNSEMGQMDKWDKWRTNGRTNGVNMEKAQIWREWDKWESVCLNIRSHLSHRLMPRIGESSGNK